ncbi:MAG: hypothetical protein EOM80_17485 [Erysipelotrichia bacterium]|nr:hypothetical protein [Erysipelotrichia bacterium]
MLSETVKSWPAQWMAKGREEGVLIVINTILNARFTDVPIKTLTQIESIKNLEILKDLSVKAATADYSAPKPRRRKS